MRKRAVRATIFLLLFEGVPIWETPFGRGKSLPTLNPVPRSARKKVGGTSLMNFDELKPAGTIGTFSAPPGGLRDALTHSEPDGQGVFWSQAFKGIKSMRLDPGGKVHFQNYHADPVGIIRSEKPQKRPAKPLPSAGRRRKTRPRIDASARKDARPTVIRIMPKTATASVSLDFDGQSNARSGGSWTGSLGGLQYGSLYRSRSKAARKDKKTASKDGRPRTRKLSDWLGRTPLKPPGDDLKPPSFSALKEAFPDLLPDGRSYERATPEPIHVEALLPPTENPLYDRWLEKDEHRGRGSQPHWHIDEFNIPFLHIAKSWGRADQGRWTWMTQEGARWWTVAARAQRMVRHKQNWWWKTEEGWLLLRKGEPSGLRHFPAWRERGYLSADSKTMIAYNTEGTRIALIAPDKSARVFAADSGKVLAYIPAN